ncbi:pentatricopeptide repeat-containing protein At2g17525, mitochondrial [Amaranthus tricolor]|uniref:pentatricopeptide repeat-containing protein At2g17525, mitochondrial n=1 Tax=Amaranthus tricolor TaxID=29722 RepID=UPI0025862325|nr:pentatricopeptide repeat-containing protein At2g17525, mitochondrial [Amaranthus tricolor]XP_057519865.1 pentatricopeptide repeat-containing protein At2g17525, mitochondrial [Amaranthus tricolor]
MHRFRILPISHVSINPKTVSCILQSKSITSLPSPEQLSQPTHQHISSLIFDQRSASEALQTFRWASELPNFTHNLLTYRALIHKLCVFRSFDRLIHLLEEIPSTVGSPPDEDIFVTLVRGLGRAQKIREVIKVIDLVHKFGLVPSLKIYNSILDALVKMDIDIARGFFRKKMMECGVQGDVYTFGTLMKGLCLTNRIGDGFKLLQIMKTRGLTPNIVIYNALLHALCKNGKVGRARSLMSEIVEPNNVTYNLMISAYCNEQNLVQALVLLEKSLALGYIPDVVTTTKVMKLLCNVGRPNEAAEVLERVEQNGSRVDIVAYNTLIKAFCSLGKAKVGLHFKKGMEIKGCLPNVETYNLLITGFCENNLFDIALDLFNEMKMAAVSPNFVTFNTLIRGLCFKGQVEDGFRFLELLEELKDGSRGHISPYNSIIYGLYRENRWNEALDFLNKMVKMFPRAVDRTLRILSLTEEGKTEAAKQVYEQILQEGGIPNAIVYSSMIQGFCKREHVREAFQLMNEMIGHGFFPVTSTYNIIINGFCSQGKTVSAEKLMKEMDERGCSLDRGTYYPLILAHCRERDLRNALKVFHQMVSKGIEPNYDTWNTLLCHLNQEEYCLGANNMAHVQNNVEWILET